MMLSDEYGSWPACVTYYVFDNGNDTNGTGPNIPGVCSTCTNCTGTYDLYFSASSCDPSVCVKTRRSTGNWTNCTTGTIEHMNETLESPCGQDRWIDVSMHSGGVQIAFVSILLECGCGH